MQLILDTIVRYSFFGMFVCGGLLLVWVIIVGFPLIMLTPQAAKDYWFLGEDKNVESSLATGWDFVVLILRFSIVHSVAFPWLSKKKGINQGSRSLPNMVYSLLRGVLYD